jgi:hypothetical protein
MILRSVVVKGWAFFSSSLGIIVAIAVALGFFYWANWLWARSAIGHVCYWFLPAADAYLLNMHEGSVYIVARTGNSYEITPECTYIDLIFVIGLLIFRLWLIKRMAFPLFALIVTASIAIATAAVLRIVFSIHLHEHGISWFWSHDLVDYMIWYGSVCALILINVVPGRSTPESRS